MKKVNSLTMFDTFKGMAILAVVYLHIAGNGQKSFQLIGSFLMLAFFMISGYGIRKKQLKPSRYGEIAKNQAKLYLKPYLIVSLLATAGIFLQKVVSGHDPLEYTRANALAYLLGISKSTRIAGIEISENVPMWFVMALFFGLLLTYGILMIQNKKLQVSLGVGSFVIGYYMCCKGINLPFQITQSLIAAGCGCFGFWMREDHFFEQDRSIYETLAMLFLWLASVRYGRNDLAYCEVMHPMLTIAGGLAGAILVIRFFLWLNQFQLKGLYPFMVMGRYTFWILCSHAVLFKIFPWKTFGRYFQKGSAEYALVAILIHGIGIFICCICLKKITYTWQSFRIRKQEQSAK